MKKIKFPTDSNVALKLVKPNKLELRFPAGAGAMQMGRHRFKDQGDLLGYLSQTFPLESHATGHRFMVTRAGKYQRFNQGGQAIFTFGDPVLDLITDEHGWLTIGGQRFDLRAAEVSDPAARGGGVQAINLLPRQGELDRVISRAALGEGDFTLVEAGADNATLASRNPSTLYFYRGSAKMRFRAFKKNYAVGWKMGADIETWGGDFTRAEIQSDYGYWVYGRACAVAKHDSDSDTTDDYVDEYEWGVFSSAPNGVRSFCTATWLGSNYTGWVSKGDCDYWL
ncbi:MAG: hypothetical protein ACT4QE_18145 [Anaerolineales bacterium]